MTNEEEYKKFYSGLEMPKLQERKYIVVSRKFEYISSAAIPLDGQIATNSKILANILYFLLHRWSYKYYGSIGVMLVKRNKEGLYDAIKR